MKRNIEVEIKYQVLNDNQIKKFLKNLQFIERKREVDIYFDTPTGDLYKKSTFIRIRNNKSLDFKYSLAGVMFQNQGKIRKSEHFKDQPFPLPLTKNSLSEINQICKVLGLKEMRSYNFEVFKRDNSFINSMTLDKIREKYGDKKFEYCLDKVKKLGTFLEVEALISDEKQVRKLKKEIENRVKDLDLKRITTGYCGLYWRKYNFDLYCQARYILQEDRH